MHAATESILTYNHGRDPERLTLKLAAIAAEPFAFFRGTNHLYAASLGGEILAIIAVALLRESRLLIFVTTERLKLLRQITTSGIMRCPK